MTSFNFLHYYPAFIIIAKHNLFLFNFKVRSFSSNLIELANIINFDHS
jgi:hypothetical protein